MHENQVRYGIGGIYEIINSVNGHSYVGSSVNIRSRWRSHRNKLMRGEHNNPVLQRAWDKYGEDKFNFRVLLVCEKFETLRYEQALLNMNNHEYNISTDAIAPMMGRHSGMLGKTHSDETKRKMSETRTGQKRTPEFCERMKQQNLGRKKSDEAKNNMRNAALGRKASDETKEKLRQIALSRGDFHSGWHHTDETKDRLSQWHKDHPEAGIRFGSGQIGTGHKHSEEAKAHMSEIKKAWWAEQKALSQEV